MRAIAAFAAAAVLTGCGLPSTPESVAPTAETIAFLGVDGGALNGCLDVEGAAIAGAAGLITGAEDGALAAAAQGGLARCRDVTRLIRVEGRPPSQAARADVCRRAFAAKVDAYTALNQALSAEGDVLAAQQGLRRFLAGIRGSAPLMRDCNTPR